MKNARSVMACDKKRNKMDVFVVLFFSTHQTVVINGGRVDVLVRQPIGFELNFVVFDVVVQLGQKIFRHIFSVVDATIVPQEIGQRHFFHHPIVVQIRV